MVLKQILLSKRTWFFLVYALFRLYARQDPSR